MAGGFGSLPSLADLAPSDLSELLARIQGQQAQDQAQPGSPDRLLFDRAAMGGGINPFVAQGQDGPATTGSTPNVPVAMSEADTRQMERGMMPRGPAPSPRVSGMNPDAAPGMPGVPAQPSVTAASTGNADASNVAPVSSFDPLTGQPVSGNPKPMQAPGQGGPSEGAARVAAAAGNPASAGPGGSFFERFAKGLNNPAIGDLLFNVGIGLMSNRGFGPGIAAGLQGYQANQGNQTKQLLQQYQLMQQIQGQNAIRTALKGKASPEMIEAAALNPSVLSSVLQQQNKDPQQFTVGGNIFLGRPDQDPSTWRQLGPAAGPPSGYAPSPTGTGVSFIPGGPEDPEVKKRNAEATASTKPQYVKMKDEQGTEHVYLADPETGALSKPPGLAEGTGSGTNPYATGKFNSDQAKAAGFSDRMLGSEPVLRQFETLNSGNALGATIAGMAPNSMKSTERQQMDQAQRDFINAQLRRESGAAISQGEFDNARSQYFPQPGDASEVIAQKRRNRQTAIEAMAREGGSSYRPKSVFDEQGNIVPFGQSGGQRTETPAQPSRAQLEAEARRRGLIK